MYMNKITNGKSPARASLRTIASPIAVGLLTLSSPFIATSATWAQQTSEVPLTNSPQVQLSVPLGKNQKPSVEISPHHQLSPLIPALIKVLQGEPSPAGFDATFAIPLLIKELQGNNPDVRAQAASAVPGILKALQNNQSQAPSTEAPNIVKTVAGNCAVKNPTSIVLELIPALRDKDELVRLFSASAINCIGQQATAAIPALTNSLKDPSRQVRLVAAFALVSVGVGLEEIAKQISPEEAKPLLSTFTSTLQVLPKQILQLPQQAINSLPNPLGQSAVPQPTSLPQGQSR
jgi:hypothetical protein